MDGKRAWRDNTFVKRLWGGKYEEVYLRAYTIGPGACASMDCYLGLPQQLMATFIADVGNLRTGPASTQRCPKSRQRIL
jgi:hypothetical protein